MAEPYNPLLGSRVACPSKPTPIVPAATTASQSTPPETISNSLLFNSLI